MKKIAFAAFIAFWSSVLTLLAVDALSPPTVAEGEELPVFTLDEVAERDTLENCWVAIEGKVYDLSDYIPNHPTPPSVIKPWCGQEASEGMRTKGYGRDHSAAAWGMLDDYLIGRLAQ